MKDIKGNIAKVEIINLLNRTFDVVQCRPLLEAMVGCTQPAYKLLMMAVIHIQCISH